MKDKIGWIIFTIGFVIASIYALPVPKMELISGANIWAVLVIAGEILVIWGSFDFIKSSFAKSDREKLSMSGWIKTGAGGGLALFSLFNLFTPGAGGPWSLFFAGVAISILGAGLLAVPRPHAHRHADAKHIDPEEWLAGLIEEVSAINFADMNKDNVKKAIEEIELNRLIPFVESRHYFSHEYGVAKFAEFFSLFSSGEMYMNRAWSSLVDGYPEESEYSLSRAKLYFEESLSKVQLIESET